VHCTHVDLYSKAHIKLKDVVVNISRLSETFPNFFNTSVTQEVKYLYFDPLIFHRCESS